MVNSSLTVVKHENLPSFLVDNFFIPFLQIDQPGFASYFRQKTTGVILGKMSQRRERRLFRLKAPRTGFASFYFDIEI